MEIKENEFIRTKTGKIDKVINNNYYMSQYIECEKRIVEKENIVKHSFNIIDLIELGDIVNGMKVNDISKIQRFNKPIQKCLWANINDGYDIINEEIKTILTHEQYEKDCCVIKEKNDGRFFGEYYR